MNKGFPQLLAHGKGIITLCEKQGVPIISTGQIRKQAQGRGEWSGANKVSHGTCNIHNLCLQEVDRD